MVRLYPNTDGRVLARLTDRQMESLIKRHGARVHPCLLEEGWLDPQELYGLAWVEVNAAPPLPGDRVFVPAGLGWALLEVA